MGACSKTPTELEELRRRNGRFPERIAMSPQEIWDGALPDGDVVRRYLRSRAITIKMPTSVRQWCGETIRGAGYAMVSAFERQAGEIVSVGQVFLSLRGNKVAPIIGFGPPLHCYRALIGEDFYGAAVRLAPAAPVLGLAEGVETGLSAMQLFGLPVWAAGGTVNLPKVILPPQVRELYLFADNDDAGEKGALDAAERHTQRGLKVTVRRPPSRFNDWNDALRCGWSAGRS